MVLKAKSMKKLNDGLCVIRNDLWVKGCDFHFLFSFYNLMGNHIKQSSGQRFLYDSGIAMLVTQFLLPDKFEGKRGLLWYNRVSSHTLSVLRHMTEKFFPAFSPSCLPAYCAYERAADPHHGVEHGKGEHDREAHIHHKK